MPLARLREWRWRMSFECLRRRAEAASTVDRRPMYRGAVAAFAIVSLLVVGSACTSSKGDSQWRGNYFKDPDSVWNAIELTLLELDYDVTDENREDGIIRAESESSEGGAVVVLAIDQVMRTQDQVNVFVKPSFATGATDADPDRLKAAGDAFMKSLNEKLNP
jgi:hypothetical protein